MNEEIKTILTLVDTYQYEVCKLEFSLRKLANGKFLVSFEQLGRSEDPKDDVLPWEQEFDTGKEAAEFFVSKSIETYGRQGLKWD